jgi:CRISPR-associated protein Cmr6
MPTNPFNVVNTILPTDTKGQIGNLEQIDNFALKLNKCINWFEKDTFDTGVPIISTMATFEKVKLDALKYKRFKDKNNDIEFRINADFSKVKVNEILKTNRENAEALCRQVKIVNDTIANWRLVVGLGIESVFETSMMLHHVYGIPYIPASGIKGAIRSWVINDTFNSNEDEAFTNDEFVNIFGSGDAEGKIIFFDAFPINLTNDSIQPDIMNPHFPEYYDGNKPPADWQNPKPIFFLTVKDTHFEFMFGIQSEDNKELLKILTASKTGWVYKALKEQGIGGKTAVGYGRMFEKVKAQPVFLRENAQTLKKNAEAEGIITSIISKMGKLEYVASIWVKENDIRENIKINGIRGEMEEGAIIKVKSIMPDKKGQFKEATFNGEKQVK